VGDVPGARDLLNEALAVARDVGDRPSESRWLGALAALAWDDGDLAKAAAEYRGAIELAQELTDEAAEADFTAQLAGVLVDSGEPVAARTFVSAALVNRDALEWTARLAVLRHTAAALDEPATSIRLVAAAESARGALGLALSAGEAGRLDHLRTRLLQAVDQPAFGTEWALGERWSVDDALAVALEACDIRR